MSVPTFFEFTRDGRVVRMTSGSTKLDQEAFRAELAAASAKSAQEGVPVLWRHNGVECSTEVLMSHHDSWAWVCEASGHMAN